MLSRPTFPELYNQPEKILLVKVGDIRASYDNQKLYCNEGIYVCIPWKYLEGVRNKSIKKFTRYGDEKAKREDLPKREDLEKNSNRFLIKYLLGIINSSVARNFLKNNRRNNIQLYPDDWKKLPIPDVTLEQQQPIIKLVDKILDIKRQNTNADTRDLEREIDEIVYELYG